VAVDLDDRKLEMAREFGATHTVNSSNEDPVEAIRAVTGGNGVDVAIEAAGHHEVLASAFRSLGSGGTVVQVGSPRPVDHLPIPLPQLFLKRATVTASVYGDIDPREGIPELLDLHRGGDLPLDEFVGGTIPLSRVPEWFENPTPGRRTVVIPDRDGSQTGRLSPG
jgi:S-(hydroxymethyl)mycothiol dehydrogenase